ncbi:MAG: SpoIIE family protein phosphatase, partial [Thermoflexibacter sp.]|nr:SpoIIE family protein phosphatase [Thermoflexibacter sp.]
FTKQNTLPNGLLADHINKLWYDKKNHYLWIATSYGGISRYDIKNNQFTNFQADIKNKNTILANIVTDICPYGEDILFVIENGGIAYYHSKTGIFTNYLHKENNPTSLSTNSVRTAYKDRQGRVWVSTYGKGACIWDRQREKFSQPDLVLPNPMVNSVIKDSKERLWVGTEGGVVLQDKEEISYFKHEASNPQSLSANPVQRIYEDAQKQIWLGSWNGGADLFDEQKKNFRLFSNPKSEYSNCVFAFSNHTDPDQVIIGSFGGVALVNKQTKQLKQFSSGSLLDTGFTYVQDIYKDSKGNIWVGAASGLHLINEAQGKHLLFTDNEQDSMSIIYKRVYFVFEDSKNRIWVGTQGGLSLMMTEGKFKNYTTKQGLVSNSINSMLEDSKGNFWIGTNKGLSMFEESTQTFTNYTESDGLPSSQFKVNSAFKNKEGKMYFGTVNGLCVFHPDSITTNPHKPQVYLTDFKIFNKSVKVGEYDSLLKNVIQQTKEITLSYQYSVFSLEYVGINFTQAQENEYAYIMEGFETEWNYVGNKREATYTSLDAGTYTFRVKASNNDGLWNEEGVALKIKILPPWWETWWFRTLFLTLFLGSGILFYFLRINAVKRQNQILEKKVVNRTQEIERQKRELEFANHQVKTKNEELLASEEELRQNMEELETNQEELRAQKEQLEVAFLQLNKQNTKVNDSIRYAQRIQNAILPHENILASAFAEHFVIFKPKDVVSGDFYWYFETTSITNKQLSITNEIQNEQPDLESGMNTNTNDQLSVPNENPKQPTINNQQLTKKKFLAVVDCTGHGVPGAFMSMIGNAVLREIVESKKIYEPAQILNELNKSIITSLNRKDKSFQDGMDIVLCCFENTPSGQVKLTYAGAKRPLYYFDTELHEIKADHTSIGHKADIQYTQSEQILQPNTTLFLTTDGWIDSINPERKRFGSQRFKDMLLKAANLPLYAQKEVFTTILEDYEQNSEQRDDVLMVGVRV